MTRLFLFISLSFIVACQPLDGGNGQRNVKLDALAGRWESLNEGTRQIEEWIKENENHYKGKGYVLEGNDTTFIEFLEIKMVNDTLNYCAQVSNQNEGERIFFKLLANAAGRWEFVNEAHDFPKKIVYELDSDTTLRTYIQGPRDGRTVRVNFDFKKTER